MADLPGVLPGGGGLTLDPIAPLPTLDPIAPAQVSLGAAAGPLPSVEGAFADMGINLGPEPGTMGSSMGSAAASMFPSLARMRVSADRAPERPSLMATAAATSAQPMLEGPPPSALELERARTRGQLGQIYSLLGAPIKKVKVANPKFEIAQRQKARFYGGGELPVEPFQPRPFKAVPRNEEESDKDYADRLAFLADVDVRQQRETYDRQVAEQEAAAQQLDDVRDIGRPGHLGMGEAQLQAAEGVGQAELEQLEATALAQREAADATQTATAEVQAADLARRERARQELEAVTHLQGVEARATERLQALPPLSDDAYFKSMKGGQKLAALIGAIGGGFGGGINIVGTLMELAERNLATQKANAAQVADKAAAASDAVGRQVGLYQDLLRSAGDEQAADAMWLKLQLQGAEKILQTRLDGTTSRVAQARLKASLVGLRQQIDVQRDAIDLRAKTTPEYFVRKLDPLTAATRKALNKRAEGLEKFDQDLAKTGIEGGQKMDIESMKVSADQAKTAKQQERDVYTESAGLADKIAEKQAVIQQIDDLKRDFEGGIPGVGPFMGTETAVEWAKGVAGADNRAYQFKKRVRQIVERGLRDATGAAAPPAEQEAYVEFIMEGSGDIGGEAKVWTNLDAFGENLKNEVDTRMRGRSEEAVEHLTRNKARPQSDPLNIGRAPAADPVRRK